MASSITNIEKFANFFNIYHLETNKRYQYG